MSIQRQFSGGVAWMAFGNWTEQAVNFLIFVILARLLGAEAFGLLAMAAVFVILSEFLVRESLSEALISLSDITPEHLNAAFWLLVLFGAGVTAVLLVAAWAIGWLYGEPRIVPLMQVLALTVPMIALTAVPVGILRREMRFRVLSLRAIAGVVAGGVAGVALAFSGAGVWALVGQRLVQVAVNIVLAWRAVDWRPKREFNRKSAAEVGRFGRQVVGLRAGEIALSQAPILVLGAVAGPVATGFYSIAWRIVDLAAVLIAMPLRQTAQPAFAALARGGGNANELLLQLIRISGWLAIPAFAGLAALSLPFLTTVFGAKWIEAAPILTALSMLGAYLCVEKQQQAYVLAHGTARNYAAITWMEAIATGVIIWTVQSKGLHWAAAAQVCVLLALWPFRLSAVGRLSGLGVVDLARPHLAPAIGAIAMVACVIAALGAMPYGPTITLVVCTGLGVTVYAAISLIFLKDRFQTAKALLIPTRAVVAQDKNL